MEEKNLTLEEILTMEGLLPTLFAGQTLTPAFKAKLTSISKECAFGELIKKLSSHIRKCLKDVEPEEGISKLHQLVPNDLIEWDLIHPSQSTFESLSREDSCVPSGVAQRLKVSESQVYELRLKHSDKPQMVAISEKNYIQKQGSYFMRKTQEKFEILDLGQRLAYALLYQAFAQYAELHPEEIEFAIVNHLSLNFSKGFWCSDEESQLYYEGLFSKYERFVQASNLLPFTTDETIINERRCKFMQFDKNFFSLDELKQHFINCKVPRYTVAPLIIDIVLGMYETSESVSVYIEQSNFERTYAASYELKKNIPLNILNTMKTSSLNKYFTEIELDELTTLKKYHDMEEEYEKYAHFFPTQKSANFRIRRLGKYKASGLFFPYYKAICVDIHTTTSMIHEVSHWLDYYFANISNQTIEGGLYCNRLSNSHDFWELKRTYINVLDAGVRELPEDSEFRNAYNGSTKYSRKYYTDPAEIFARCSELYFQYTYGDSILWDVSDVAYPTDEKLKQLILNYYGVLFEKTKALVPVTVPSIMEEKMVATPCKKETYKNSSISFSIEEENNQLNLFGQLF